MDMFDEIKALAGEIKLGLARPRITSKPFAACGLN